MSRDNLLFAPHDWFSVEEHQKNQLREEVGTYDGNRLLNTPVDDLSGYFADKYSMDVPVLQRDAIVADQRETKIDKSHDFLYGPRFDGRPIMVDGSTVEITVPFTGDGSLFSVRPTTYSTNPPRASIRGDTLVLQFSGVDQSSGQLKSEIEKALTDIETHLDRLRKSAETLNGSLRSMALQAIETRREKLLANQNLVSSLEFARKGNRSHPGPSNLRKLTFSQGPIAAKTGV